RGVTAPCPLFGRCGRYCTPVQTPDTVVIWPSADRPAIVGSVLRSHPCPPWHHACCAIRAALSPLGVGACASGQVPDGLANRLTGCTFECRGWLHPPRSVWRPVGRRWRSLGWRLRSSGCLQYFATPGPCPSARASPPPPR